MPLFEWHAGVLLFSIFDIHQARLAFAGNGVSARRSLSAVTESLKLYV